MTLSKRPRALLPRFTDRLPLGQGGLRVSPFCLGMVRSEDTVCAAFDAGINFFFLSADMHWPLYEPSRRGLEKLLARGEGVRQQLVVGVAIYPTHPEFCLSGFGEVLEAVAGLEFVDVAIAGGAYSGEFMTRLRVFHQIRQERYRGVRAIGATFHDRKAALLSTNYNLVDISFIRYNPSHRGAAADLFPHLVPTTSTLLYNFKSTGGFVSLERNAELGFGEGYWQPDVTDYYRFALTRPAIDGLLCSPSTPEELAALCRALEEGPLDEEEEQYLLDLVGLNEASRER